MNITKKYTTKNIHETMFKSWKQLKNQYKWQGERARKKNKENLKFTRDSLIKSTPYLNKLQTLQHNTRVQKKKKIQEKKSGKKI